MINAGKFINLKILHQNFGKERVLETARRLREAKHFPKGKKELSIDDISIFIYCLMATKSVVHVLMAAYNYKICCGKSISIIFDDFRVRQALYYIEVSTVTGSIKYLSRNDLYKHNYQQVNIKADYDNDKTEKIVDNFTRAEAAFFENLFMTCLKS